MHKENLFEGMKDRSRKLYEQMWGDGSILLEMGAEIEGTKIIEKNKVTGHSRNSFSFVCDNTDQAKKLIEIFDIANKEDFRDKYKMAVGGSGGEDKKIMTLHSSSLCALLHFYNVNEINALKLTFTTNKKTRTVVFTDVYFEYKSPVMDPRYPSNMDVVLIGKDGDEDIVLFLESKFSEYYMYCGKSLADISKEYRENPFTKEFYEDSFLERLGLHKSKEADHKFSLETDKPFYIGGIKQMISHYCGIQNIMTKSLPAIIQECGQDIVTGKIKDGVTVILGEILFDDRIGGLNVRPEINCLKAYEEKYAILAGEMADLTEKDSKFEIIMNDLGYSMFKDNGHIIEYQHSLSEGYENLVLKASDNTVISPISKPVNFGEVGST